MVEDKPKSNDCPECGKTFEKGLEKHIQRVHAEKRWLCEHCDARFTLKDNLNRHINGVHLGQLLQCGFCSYTAKEKKSVMKHAKKHHPLDDLKRMKLSKVFPKEGEARRNRRQRSYTSMMEVREHQGYCPSCGKYFKRNNDLARHIERIHGDKYWLCEHCDAKFKREDGKQRHVLTVHLSEKFQCDFCPYQAAEKRTVKAHAKGAHPLNHLEQMKFEKVRTGSPVFHHKNDAILERFKLLYGQ